MIKQIADPHLHFWQLGRLHYPWLMDRPVSALAAANPDLTKDYLLADYLADAEGLDLVTSVHVEANPDPKDCVAETAWLQGLAEAPESRGFPHGLVAFADLTADDAADTIAAHCSYPNLRGIRQCLNRGPEPLMRNDIWHTNFKRLGDLGLSFDMHIEAAQMADGAKLAADHPNIRIALNHTGLPDMTSVDGVEAWRRGMRLLAPWGNISVKLSGFGMLDPKFTPESILPFILETIDLFGVGRCMFASNYPVDRLFVSYRDLWQAYKQITEDFTDDEKSQLFHDNAVAFYRL